MANVDFTDGSAMRENAESMKELWEKIGGLEAALGKEIANVEILRPHPFAGSSRRCGKCGGLAEDKLHIPCATT